MIRWLTILLLIVGSLFAKEDTPNTSKPDILNKKNLLELVFLLISHQI